VAREIICVAAADGELAVVGVLYEEGAQNAVLAPVFDNAPQQAGGKKALANKLNPSSMPPRSRAHYAFMGSLTTPPCSEGVNWFVMKATVKLSGEQIKVMTDMHPNTARPLQARNDREIRSVR
jgi:carbonic anhydrase